MQQLSQRLCLFSLEQDKWEIQQHSPVSFWGVALVKCLTQYNIFPFTGNQKLDIQELIFGTGIRFRKKHWENI